MGEGTIEGDRLGGVGGGIWMAVDNLFKDNGGLRRLVYAPAHLLFSA